MASRYVPIFNKQIEKFLDQLEDRFPREKDIGLLKSGISVAKKTHPEHVVNNYYKHVYIYKESIEKEDENFFLDVKFVPKLDDIDKNEVQFKVQHFKKLFKSDDMDVKTKENIWVHLKLLNRLIDRIIETREISF
jgi:hypothetical protein